MVTGIVFAYNENINVKYNEFAKTFKNDDPDQLYNIKDTVFNVSDLKTSMVIPMYYGLGLTLQKDDKYIVGVDILTQNWSDYKFNDVKDSLVNSLSVSVGGEYIPDINSINNYLKRVHYRIGGNYSQTYLNIKNSQLNKKSMTLGLGLPLRRIKVGEKYSTTLINFGIEFGNRGTMDNNLIKEQFVNINFGFTFSDIWFLKRKFD